MTDVDNPLKILITTFSEAFAGWFLGSPPRLVQPLNVELPASTTRSDLIFEVVQANGQVVLLHIELQGRSSAEPMPWRILDYLSRLAKRELGQRLPDGSVRLHSVVLYLGPGAGANDTGHYEILGPGGLPSLSWRYEPILLWRMEAEELIALGQPAFLALVGQTRLREPERVLPQVVADIQRVEDEVQPGRLLTLLASLISDQEAQKMAEKMLSSLDEYMLQLPYQQRILQLGREEGLAKGKEAGLVEGLAKGKEEGILAGLREAVLEAIVLRFNPPASDYLQVSRPLESLTNREALQNLLMAAIQSEDMPAFVARLAKELPGVLKNDRSNRN